MGKRKYPPLTQNEVVAILKKLGFAKKHQVGSHVQYERAADGKCPRSVVTVDLGVREFGDFLIKNMIEQSNRSREEFYGATKRTATRAAVPFQRFAISETDPE
jgi:predicted RNA binding protein YcfA (HicA-like mRNA interferase family)